MRRGGSHVFHGDKRKVRRKSFRRHDEERTQCRMQEPGRKKQRRRQRLLIRCVAACLPEDCAAKGMLDRGLLLWRPRQGRGDGRRNAAGRGYGGPAERFSGLCGGTSSRCPPVPRWVDLRFLEKTAYGHKKGRRLKTPPWVHDDITISDQAFFSGRKEARMPRARKPTTPLRETMAGSWMMPATSSRILAPMNARMAMTDFSR